MEQANPPALSDFPWAAALLSGAAAKAEPVLVVECSALTFMSVSAWRAAVNATDALRARGGRVLLSGVSPLGRHVLKTTGSTRLSR